jgi:hypothetical protein
MQKALRAIGSCLALLGVGVTCVGLYLVGFALFAPTQPPPSLNEGHGLAWFIGIMISIVGLAALTIGVSLQSASKENTRVGAAEQAVAAAERHVDRSKVG